jgi:hypothetical protein
VERKRRKDTSNQSLQRISYHVDVCPPNSEEQQLWHVLHTHAQWGTSNQLQQIRAQALIQIFYKEGGWWGGYP